MSPVYKLSANSVKNGRTVYGSMLAGNSAFVPLAFESIATVSVGSGGSNSVEFTSIPGTYTHLQIRYIARDSRAATQSNLYMEFNGDTGNNYTGHRLEAARTSVGAGYDNVNANLLAGRIMASSNPASTFGAGIIDILDYTNTNKYKTTRHLTGNDDNTIGAIFYISGLWMSTSAITSIKITPITSPIVQYSHFALYGIKAA